MNGQCNLSLFLNINIVHEARLKNADKTSHRRSWQQFPNVFVWRAAGFDAGNQPLSTKAAVLSKQEKHKTCSHTLPYAHTQPFGGHLSAYLLYNVAYAQ